MAEFNWNDRVAEVKKRCDDWGREEYLDYIDDIVGGLDREGVCAAHKIRPQQLASAIGHVSASVHGSRPVPAVEAGGWIGVDDETGVYTVNPDFAAAWKAARPKKH